MKWNISCHINEQGYNSHQWIQTFKYEFLRPEGPWDGEQCLQSSSCQAAATPYGPSTEELRMWKSNQIKSNQIKSNCRMLPPDSWAAYERNAFSKPRLSHLPIHRKALNSLTWDIWFSLINNNLLMFRGFPGSLDSKKIFLKCRRPRLDT